MKQILTCAFVTGMILSVAQGDITVPGANGADGSFNPSSSVQIDLSLARTGAWDSPHTDPNQAGKGVYDPEKWAVVFRYTEVNIPSGKTVTFKNHPSGAPVVWLVSGPVTISGTVSLNGQEGIPYSGDFPEGGPGGFRGGRCTVGSTVGSYGFGPGGGDVPGQGTPGSYATVGSGNAPSSIYGNPGIIPLIGGSGGGGHQSSAEQAGGAGGGAILIACPGRMLIVGGIEANGGRAHGRNAGIGSGGAIRLVAERIDVSGSLRAIGPLDIWGRRGGQGRIRLEANQITGDDVGSPVPSIGQPGETAQLWPESDAPKIRSTELASLAVPEDPRPHIVQPADVQIATLDPVTLRIEAENIPTDGSWSVVARMVPWTGDGVISAAAFVSGTPFLSVWETELTLPKGHSSIQVRAYKNASP